MIHWPQNHAGTCSICYQSNEQKIEHLVGSRCIASHSRRSEAAADGLRLPLLLDRGALGCKGCAPRACARLVPAVAPCRRRRTGRPLHLPGHDVPRHGVLHGGVRARPRRAPAEGQHRAVRGRHRLSTPQCRSRAEDELERRDKTSVVSFVMWLAAELEAAEPESSPGMMAMCMLLSLVGPYLLVTRLLLLRGSRHYQHRQDELGRYRSAST
uniref:Uncharacterized protein n=1 Tax=Arundo donax TaxID=35708 RepID=A0A0A9HKB2_ARUDO